MNHLKTNKNPNLETDTKVVSRLSLFGEDEESFEAKEDDVNVELLSALEAKMQNFISGETKEFSGKLGVEDSTQTQGEHEEEQVFRLFSGNQVSHISLEVSPFPQGYVSERKIEYEMLDDSERIQNLTAAAITADQVIKESTIPWERHFFPKRVTVIPTIPPHIDTLPRSLKRRRPSKKQREFRKKVRAGLIPAPSNALERYAERAEKERKMKNQMRKTIRNDLKLVKFPVASSDAKRTGRGGFTGRGGSGRARGRGRGRGLTRGNSRSA
ncbi:uncharacterized protein VTP21DRAFT_8750 [Calcarisporiella thermophila]|uniref:uncharacterized protein n=1 Tax=Calcarisporiella thermophila TaxID=911321 RepID=UPI0037429DD7